MNEKLANKLEELLSNPDNEVIETEFGTITKVKIDKNNTDDPMLEMLQQMMLAQADCSETKH